MEALQTANSLVGIGTLLLEIATVALLILYFVRKRYPILSALSDFLSRRGLSIALIFSALGAAITLYYSEALGIEPCSLCWWQRIFLYPQIVLFALALWMKDMRVAVYSMALSVIGAGFGLYQHVLQMMGEGSLPCPASTVSCAQRFLYEFNHITFPFAAFVLFAFLIVLMLFVRARRLTFGPETV